MKKEVCLMCIVCFFLGYFICDVIGKCGFGREHFLQGKLTKTIDEELRCRAKPRFQPNKEEYCESIPMSECANDDYCETY